MNRYVSGQRFLGLRSVLLDNGVQDDSLLKERIAFQLFERLGVPVAREAPARLYVNNYYWGAYVVIEDVDEAFLARVAGGAEGGVPYLFEYRWIRPYDVGYLGEEPAPYAELFEPRTHETDAPAALYDPLRELTRRLADAEDGAVEDAVAPYLDVDQFVRIAAIENYLAEIDGLLGAWGMNNFYLYRPAGTTRARLVPWDKDVAFHDVGHPLWFNVDGNVLMRRALQVPRLRELYLETVAACVEIAAAPAPGDPRGWLEREIDAGVQQIGASVQADRARPQAHAALVAEAARLTAFARARGPILACAIAAARGEPAEPACQADALPAPPAAQNPIFRSANSGR